MEEVKVAGGNAASAKRRTAWCVVKRFSDGLVVRSGILFDTDSDARECALGMRDFCLNNGDLKGAERYDGAKFAVFHVEFDEPEIDWKVDE
ncbi:MAG: hypothetical protein IIZ06_06795 [Kiritimatiellae bacterium]|nr:hypothetical protein [Kiritimatiellia bacterium]